MRKMYILELFSTGDTYVSDTSIKAKEYAISFLRNDIPDYEVDKEEIEKDIALIEEHAKKFNGEFDSEFARCYAVPVLE